MQQLFLQSAMEEHNKDDNGGHPDLVAGGKRLTHCMAHFQGLHPTIPFSAIWASMFIAWTVRPCAPCYMLPYCCWLRRGPHNSSNFRVSKMWVRYRYQGSQIIHTPITQHVACINISLSISIYTLSTHKQIYSGIEHFNAKK